MAWKNFTTEQLRAMDDAHHIHPFMDSAELRREGVRVVSDAERHHLRDTEGNRILDGMAGLWCVNAGYGRKELADAAYEQMLELPYYNTFFKTTHPPVALLAKRLADLAPAHINQVFFGASGSESNDTAIRTVRHYWALKGRPEKHVIVSRDNAYHGSTLGAVSMGGMSAMHGQMGPHLPGFRHAMAPYDFELAEPGESRHDFGIRAARDIERIILETGPELVAAVVAEPIQGAGGVKIPPESYWPEVQRICRDHEVLLMLDEVITGFGRTGEWFAAQSMDIRPDTMTIAKGLTSGYQPLSGVMFSDEIADVLAEGGEYVHGYTYSGHPVACAVALANIDLIEREELVERVRDETGPYLTEHLAEVLGDHPLVGEVRGFGLLAGIEIVADRETRKRFERAGRAAATVRDHAITGGLMVRAVGDTMILSPPLSWTKEEIEEAAEKLKGALDGAGETLQQD